MLAAGIEASGNFDLNVLDVLSAVDRPLEKMGVKAEAKPLE